MQVIADFLTDSLVLPAYFYFFAYGFVWLMAFVLARLFVGQKGVELAAKRAWGIALFLHLVVGTLFIIWVSLQAEGRFEEWFHVFLYLVFYIIIVIADVCLLFALRSQKPTKQKVGTSSQKPAGKSINPKQK